MHLRSNCSMEEWKEYKLEDIGKITTGKTPKAAIKEYFDGNILFVTPADINTPYKYVSKTARYLSEKGLNSISSNSIEKGSICVSCIGNIGYVGIVNMKCASNQQINSITVNKEHDRDFVYYAIKNLWPFFKNYEGQSTTLSILNKGQFSKIVIKVPQKDIQQRIAFILSSLDDKIELNRKINANLEAQAQALFKSWFVDFEPFRDGEFVESELGRIPKGWKVVSLDKIAEISKSSINPQKYSELLFEHYSIPSFDDGLKPEKQLGEDIKSNKFVIANKMTLFSKLNPRIKRVWYVDKLASNSICSTEFVPYKAKEDSKSSFVYGLINSQVFYDFVMSMVNGATGSHQRFHPEESMKFKIAYDADYVSKYCNLTSFILSQILNYRDESRRLASLRDTLLPRLMSGELKVNEVI